MVFTAVRTAAKPRAFGRTSKGDGTTRLHHQRTDRWSPVRRDFTYSAFHLKLRSNLAIPGLVACESRVSFPSVRLHLGCRPAEPQGFGQELIYTSAYLDDTGEPALRVWQMEGTGNLHLAYSNGMEFWIDRGGSQVWAVWPAESSLEDAATYLLGPVLGALLRIRGTACLHASAVAWQGRAIAFVGPPGAGKSTTAAMLTNEGCALLSDDVLALKEHRGILHVLPAYPFLCLWPESAALVCGSTQSLPRFVPAWEKRCLAVAGPLKLQTHMLPLAAVCVLSERAEGCLPSASRLPPQTALAALLANSYGARMLLSEMRAREFRVLTHLVCSTPIWSVRVPGAANKIASLLGMVVGWQEGARLASARRAS